jgi:hypothetical protein
MDETYIVVRMKLRRKRLKTVTVQTPTGLLPNPQGQPSDKAENSEGAMALTEQTKGERLATYK